MENKPLQTNRCSIPQGYQFDYLQQLAAQLGITDTSQAVQVVILDHIRHIGLSGAALPIEPDNVADASTSSAIRPEENLLAGLLPSN